MPANFQITCAEVKSYQIYAYHEVTNDLPRTDLWRKIGDVNSLPLPMACSLSEVSKLYSYYVTGNYIYIFFFFLQFKQGEKYHFAIRALDAFNRCGPFGEIQKVFLTY